MLPPRLPDPVAPARHELVTSYTGRLAAIHGLDADDLWNQISEQVPGGMRRAPVPERLAALTGRTVHDLAGALPEIRDPAPDWAMFRHQPQTGCHLCDAKHPGGKVTRILPHHRYVCTRHQRWIGPPDIDKPAPDISELPAIVQAQRRHLRILRQHGWAAAYDAVLTAFTFCGHIWSWWPIRHHDPRHVCHTWDTRAQLLIPAGEEWKTFTTSKLFAAVYPEAVNLAGIIASPYWRRLAGGTSDDREHFTAEIARRITYPYREPDDHGDAIEHWAIADSWRPLTQPQSVHKPIHLTGTISPLHSNRVNRHSKSAIWFGKNRKAGSTLLHHGHVKAALLRPWRPDYERIEGTISHSGHISSNMKASIARERATVGNT